MEIMIFICAAVLFVGVGVSGKSDDKWLTPPYVQSRDAFTYARNYLLERLPRRDIDIHNKNDLPKFSLEVFMGLVGEMVLAAQNDPHFSPLLVIQQNFPYVFKNYTDVSHRVRNFLERTNNKILVITNLMDSICLNLDEDECNLAVAKAVEQKPQLFRLPAELLLSLRSSGRTLEHNIKEFNDMQLRNGELPYLVKNANSKSLKLLVEDLVKVLNHFEKTPTQRMG